MVYLIAILFLSLVWWLLLFSDLLPLKQSLCCSHVNNSGIQKLQLSSSAFGDE
ncbi:hypothetical protein C2S53_008919, partial [Perilla frutescens var. hirtella]